MLKVTPTTVNDTPTGPQVALCTLRHQGLTPVAHCKTLGLIYARR